MVEFCYAFYLTISDFCATTWQTLQEPVILFFAKWADKRAFTRLIWDSTVGQLWEGYYDMDGTTKSLIDYFSTHDGMPLYQFVLINVVGFVIFYHLIRWCLDLFE